MPPGQEFVGAAAGEDGSQVESTIKRFETAWRQGLRPTIDDYLPADVELRQVVLVELVHTDLELRLKAGEVVRVEEHLARYPELTADRAAVLELIATEHELRRRVEPGLSLDEYLQRFPLYRDDLPARIAGATVIDRDNPWHPSDPLRRAPPEVAGYEILGPLGRGGMGVVHKARQLNLNRLVALKFLPEECARDPLWLERFRREGSTASALNHPHICTIYATGECAGRPFLSMELIEGQTLEELVEQRLPVEEMCRLIGQVAKALHAAHAAGIIHRDIKPQNIMVRADGIVKVLDFGLARRLSAGPTPGGGTDPGTRVGTVLYMSPEQTRAEVVGTPTDIFSLGIVLYELATGKHPFLTDTEFGVLHAIVAHTPVPPARLNPEIPAALEGLIQQMLAKDPRLRPTAAEVDALLIGLTEKGIDRPASPAPSQERHSTVGRQEELAALHTSFEATAAGRGMMVCVAGEPGIGKTTLVEQFLQELATAGRTGCIARGRCSERLAGTEAYLPFLEALDNLLQASSDGSAALMMKRVAPAWYAQLAPVAANGPGSAHELPEATGASPERMKRELGLLLHEWSRQQPVVLFLDDVHWADASSVDLLAYLGGKCAGLRLLLVLTYRPSELVLSQHPFGPIKQELQGRGVCREIAPRLLSRGDVDRYLALTYVGHQLPEELAGVIHAKTGGNPLFMVDLLRYLGDRGILIQEQGRWTLAQAVLDIHRELPESVRSIIQRKVEQLSEADRLLLMAASVQGQEFDSSVVAQVLGRDASAVEERLDVLERVHGLIRLVREQELPDRTLTLRYGFVHALYQNALYDSLRPTRKAAWSAAAAQALLRHHGEQSASVASDLALLFEAARDPTHAAIYFLQAAENAVRVSAYQEAIVLARRGLSLLETLPDTLERARLELPLLLALGVPLVATKGFASPEVEQTYLRARALCQRAEDLPTLFPVLYGLWNLYLVRCELLRCKELAMQMFSLARDQRDPAIHLVAHNVLQQPLFHLGDFAESSRHQEQGWALYDPHEHRALTVVYGEDPGVGCLVYGALTLWQLGYPDQALRSIQTALQRAEELSYPFNVAQAMYYGALTHLCRREVGRTDELARGLMDLCREQGFTMLFAGGMILHGWSLTWQAQRQEGLDLMRRGLADWQATGALSHRPFHLALLADVLGRDGQVAEGQATLAEALALVQRTEERFWEAELHRLQGELLLMRAEAEEAETCIRRSLDVARHQKSAALELRAAMSLSRRLQKLGRPIEARQMLSAICSRFTEGVDLLDLVEAKGLLEELA
jgi:predicted ATPase